MTTNIHQSHLHSSFGSARAPYHRMTEVRILFEGAFMTFLLSDNASFADLAERVSKFDGFGEARCIELRFGRSICGRSAATVIGVRIGAVRHGVCSLKPPLTDGYKPVKAR